MAIVFTYVNVAIHLKLLPFIPIAIIVYYSNSIYESFDYAKQTKTNQKENLKGYPYGKQTDFLKFSTIYLARIPLV